MAPRDKPSFRQCRVQLWRRRSADCGPKVQTVALKDFERNEQLAARGMSRKCLQQSGNGIGAPGMTGEVADLGLAALGENPRRQEDEVRGCPVRVGLKIGERSHRLVVEIESARTDQGCELLHWQPVMRRRTQQCRRDRMGCGFAGPASANRIGPPLQANFACNGLMNELADAGNFDIEGVERVKRGANRGRREQGCQEAVLVGLAQEPLAITERRLDGSGANGLPFPLRYARGPPPPLRRG